MMVWKKVYQGYLKLGGQGRPSLRRWRLTLSPGRCRVTSISGPQLLSVTWGTGLTCQRDGEKRDKGDGWDPRSLEEQSFQALEVEAKCMDLMLESTWGEKNPPSAGGGEGDGTPLQHSCLENPMDGGAWWAAVHGVTKSRTRLSDWTELNWVLYFILKLFVPSI